MATYEVDKQTLLTRIHRDAELMLSFYLGEQLELGVPAMHVELWDEFLDVLDSINAPGHMVGILKKLMAIPREHAKTTLTKVAVILFLRYSRLSFCAYVSNTFGVAMNAIRDIKEWLLSAQETQLYGAAEVKKSSETEGLYIIDIRVPGSQVAKRIILKAFGQGTQIRGTIINNTRPDILIFDDIESRETASSPTLQAKLDAWAMGTALKAMGRRGVCIFIGNMINERTLLARLSKDPSWRATVLGSIVMRKSGLLEPLWPGRWTLEALLTDYASFRRIGQGHIWEAEMMNLTAEQVLGESLSNAIRVPRPDSSSLEAGFICLDPAFGLNAWNDDSAITVHGRMFMGDIPILLESTKGKWSTERVFDEMLSASLRWGIRTWVIEAQAAQRLLIPLFKSYMIQRQMSEQLVLMLPVMAGKEAKASRIVSFRAAVAHGSYAIAEEEEELIQRLEAYVPAASEHDDLVDSAAYGTIIWALHGEQIRSQGRVDLAGMLFHYSGGEGVAHNALDMGIP